MNETKRKLEKLKERLDQVFSKMERGKLKDELCFLQGSIEELEKGDV